MQQRWKAAASRILLSIGAMLLLFWALAQVHARLASSLALAQVPVAHIAEANVLAIPADSPVDMSLWSAKRIAEFKSALSLKSDPPVAIVRIPRLHLEAPVFTGTDDVNLNRGLGWIDGTAVPGSDGNSGIAGHRDGFFRPLKDITVDDRIEIQTHDGVKVYTVRNFEIVDPTQVDVLAPTSDAQLTLVTCFPFYFVGPAPKRFIVRAVAATPPAPRPPS